MVREKACTSRSARLNLFKRPIACLTRSCEQGAPDGTRRSIVTGGIAQTPARRPPHPPGLAKPSPTSTPTQRTKKLRRSQMIDHPERTALASQEQGTGPQSDRHRRCTDCGLRQQPRVSSPPALLCPRGLFVRLGGAEAGVNEMPRSYHFL